MIGTDVKKLFFHKFFLFFKIKKYFRARNTSGNIFSINIIVHNEFLFEKTAIRSILFTKKNYFKRKS